MRESGLRVPEACEIFLIGITEEVKIVSYQLHLSDD